MLVNYNQISKTYDNVRSEDRGVLDLLIDEQHITNLSKVLDFGCGTGN